MIREHRAARDAAEKLWRMLPEGGEPVCVETEEGVPSMFVRMGDSVAVFEGASACAELAELRKAQKAGSGRARAAFLAGAQSYVLVPAGEESGWMPSLFSPETPDGLVLPAPVAASAARLLEKASAAIEAGGPFCRAPELPDAWDGGGEAPAGAARGWLGVAGSAIGDSDDLLVWVSEDGKEKNIGIPLFPDGDGEPLKIIPLMGDRFFLGHEKAALSMRDAPFAEGLSKLGPFDGTEVFLRAVPDEPVPALDSFADLVREVLTLADAAKGKAARRAAREAGLGPSQMRRFLKAVRSPLFTGMAAGVVLADPALETVSPWRLVRDSCKAGAETMAELVKRNPGFPE